MARIFATNETRTVEVEIEQGQLDGKFSAFCSACGPTSDLFEDERPPRDRGDAIQIAGAHAEACGIPR